MAPESGRKQRLTKDRILITFRESDHAFLTTGEVVEDLNVSRPTAIRRLNQVVDDGELEMRETAGTNIYWLPGRVAGEPDRIVSPDKLVLDLDDRLREELEARANEEGKTPERLAKDLLDDALAGPPLPHWDTTKTLGFAFSLIFLGYGVLVQSVSSGPVYQVATAITGIAMLVFLVSLISSFITPAVNPILASAQEWWASRRD